jgi:hypothetical protein
MYIVNVSTEFYVFTIYIVVPSFVIFIVLSIIECNLIISSSVYALINIFESYTQEL